LLTLEVFFQAADLTFTPSSSIGSVYVANSNGSHQQRDSGRAFPVEHIGAEKGS
jgi:hypothetical protein